jgi:signal transduction histidine kinase
MPQLLDVNRLVQDMRDRLRCSLGADIEIEIVACPDLWQTNADRSQLENSVIDLAVNARDAMPEGGEPTIETANIYLDSDYARRHPGVMPGQYVLLESAAPAPAWRPKWPTAPSNRSSRPRSSMRAAVSASA